MFLRRAARDGLRPLLARHSSPRTLQLSKFPQSHFSTSTRLLAAQNVASPSALSQRQPSSQDSSHQNRFREFDLAGKVFLVTGGARGLGLAMAEALVEAGGKVYCLDRAAEPSDEFLEAQKRASPDFGGSLIYDRVDVTDPDNVERVSAEIADKHSRMDGLIAAAGIQQVTPALEYSVPDMEKMLAVNYTGVFTSAKAAARQMIKYDCKGSIVLIASISGLIANVGLITPVYNSSKAAVIQLGRNLAMEWAPMGIRVNSICPGHFMTPMVAKNFEDEPHLRPLWEGANMMKRLGHPSELRAPALFLLSDASSFMTGSALIIDGGHTAW